MSVQRCCSYRRGGKLSSAACAVQSPIQGYLSSLCLYGNCKMKEGIWVFLKWLGTWVFFPWMEAEPQFNSVWKARKHEYSKLAGSLFCRGENVLWAVTWYCFSKSLSERGCTHSSCHKHICKRALTETSEFWGSWFPHTLFSSKPTSFMSPGKYKVDWQSRI